MYNNIIVTESYANIRAMARKALSVICTLFTGHPVRRVFLCVTVMSIS